MKKIIKLTLSLTFLLLLVSSCKPKQSAYKSVYEAAKEKELKEDKPAERRLPASSEVVVRKEKISAVDPNDASSLKEYSVVIASLSVKINAESLKSRMEDEGYNVILAKNEQGMYRVIIASHDDKETAELKRSEIYSKYSAIGTADQLRKRFGVPFNDLWILHKSF